MLHFKVLVTKSGHFIENIAFLKIHHRGITIHQNRSKLYVDFKNTILNTKYVTILGIFLRFLRARVKFGYENFLFSWLKWVLL